MQLDLFQWDALAVGNGYRCLAGLNFRQARTHFNNVRKTLPDHPAARQGLLDLEFWEEVFTALPGLEPEPAIRLLWDRINTFSFGATDGYRALRLSLLRHLLSRMDGLDGLYIPADLCRGYLHLELENYGAAAVELRLLLAHLPDNGRLHGYLADALWLLGKQEEAGAAYMTALLLDPAEVNTAALRNHPLLELIHEHGPALTPVYGYLAGLLPLIEPPARAAAPEAKVYTHLRDAELARLRDDHQAMITARRNLKNLAPALLQEYLDRLDAPAKI
jgi:tetratricopeptide (TPR) repeat protein